MDKYAKHREVAEKKLRATHWETLAVRVNETVDALASAGLLRGEMDFLNHVADGQTITRLTRERDSLREDLAQEHAALGVVERERDEARRLIAEYRKVAERYEANTASPEVLRVIDALATLKAANLSDPCRNHWWTRPDSEYCSPEWRALTRAYNALSASRQPKAQEPRFAVQQSGHGHSVIRVIDSHMMAGFWNQTDTLAKAEAECARLNGEGGGK